MSLSYEEKQELYRLKDHIISRYEYYADLVNNNRLSLEQARSLLVNELGGEPKQLIARINNLLHKTKEPDNKLAVLVCSLSVLILLLASVFHPQITGYAVKQNIILSADDNYYYLEENHTISELKLSLTYYGSDTFKLILQDKYADHLLAEGTSTTLHCSGCNKTYHPPYLLSLKEGSGTLKIYELNYKQEVFIN